MAKFRGVAITADDVEEYLATQDDFALELFVYSQARALGLATTHGGTYEDPVTKKPRQYDVRAYFAKNNCRIDLAIECKSLRPSYPLLISRIGRIAEESFHQLVFSYQPMSSHVMTGRGITPAEVVTVGRGESIYSIGQYVGKSTAQIGRNDNGDFISTDSEIYDKWSQALASASELLSDAVYHHSKFEMGFCITAVIPILVVSDDTLWVADYSDNGVLQSKPRQVDDALLYVGREYSKPMSISYNVTHLHVCTKTAVPKLLERITTDQNFWDSVFPEEAIDRVSAKIYSS